jgi:hypothetical protein
MSRSIGHPRAVSRSNSKTWFYIVREGLELFHSGVGCVGVLSWRQIKQARTTWEKEEAARAAEGGEG